MSIVDASEPEGQPADPIDNGKPRSRRWIWFFAILGVLTASAVAVEIWFNLKQQLKPEDLAIAKDRWRASAPADYDLEYSKRGDSPGLFLVKVRRGRIVSATMDGRPMEARLWPYYDMGGLFDIIERFLDIDRAPGSPRSFATAKFDPVDGHVQHYIRSVMASRQRIEITVALRRAPEVEAPRGPAKTGDGGSGGPPVPPP